MNDKPCKGTGKATKYGCGNPSAQRKYGLCMDCFRVWLYSTPEGGEVVKKYRIKAHRRVKTEQQKEAKEKKESRKSIAKLIQEARKPFQQWIRLRDANRLCVSCGKDSETWNGGHFLKAELYTGLIFDERNVHKQCVYCNKHLDGNEGEYRKRLIERFGQDWMDQLDADSVKQKSYKFTRDELVAIKRKYQKLLLDAKSR